MGAKQSKRSVDISGKEAEGGEVAAAGAGGEGRVEPLADADTLKPQLNGDAHIHEQTEKEKQLDSGTPENEKDATTEKEGKEQENEEKAKEEAPANGEGETKPENGEATPTPEEGKKPKKEKVKKKWSFRSISFSRKDKPKQEKKLKEEEPKANGEPEKLPEEAAEAANEIVVNEVAEEVKADTESKDEKTPETPVTEPLTNGSESPASAASPARPEPAQLPLNGLSLEEPAQVTPPEEPKPQETPVEIKETAPVPEIPVKKEVCVEQMPIESTPPPLPANPPPSSVASFAATTMAPELTDASLANTTDIVVSNPLTVLDTKPDISNEIPVESLDKEEIITTEIPSPLKETVEEKPAEVLKDETVQADVLNKLASNEKVVQDQSIEKEEVTEVIPPAEVIAEVVPSAEIIAEVVPPAEVIAELVPPAEVIPEVVPPAEAIAEVIPPAEAIAEVVPSAKITAEVVPPAEQISELEPTGEVIAEVVPPAEVKPPATENIEPTSPTLLDLVEKIDANEVSEPLSSLESPVSIPEPVNDDIIDSVDDLPPPPPLEEDVPVNDGPEIAPPVEEKVDAPEIAPLELPNNTVTEQNGDSQLHTEENITNTIVDVNTVLKKVAESVPQGIADPAQDLELVKSNHVEEVHTNGIDKASLNGNESTESDGPPPGRDAATSQEVAVSDKIADLIPEVPAVPELNTDTLQETTNDVAVAN